MARFLRQTRLYRRASARIIRALVREHGTYAQRFPNDIGKLHASLRPGDVVLVEGSQRISQIIKYLTQSSWSHAALYVGDTISKRGGSVAKAFENEYGDEANMLLIEANAETGVTAVPLSKYERHNIRICRPINLRPGDLSTVLETVIEQIGTPYNVGQIMDLLRYFFPISLIGFGRGPLRHAEPGGPGFETISKDVICSSQIAMAFQKVRYPIQPTFQNGEARSAAGSIMDRIKMRVFRREPPSPSFFDTGIFTPCDPRLVTPRDFDLSPYFEVVKLPNHERRDFDYKKIRWAADVRQAVAASPARAEGVSAPDAELPDATETPQAPLGKTGVLAS